MPGKSLQGYLKESEKILVFTGAGISTGSGIPDFRGPDGLWKKMEPVLYQDFLASGDSRAAHWDYKLKVYEAFKSARPNAAHKAVYELDRKGKLLAVVTQNIDGLHEDAGHRREKIVELHGTNRHIECLGCDRTYEPGPIFERFRETRKCPVCDCGGFLKTATVMFGEPMPEVEMRRAVDFASQADLVMAIGSTLQVEPAASVPLVAARNGAPYVIINRGPTAHDSLAILRLEGDAAELLPEAVKNL